MEKHFNDKNYAHWYNRNEIEELCILPVSFANLQLDANLQRDWPNLPKEVIQRPTQTFACIALAMHNIIVKEQSNDSQESLQHRKIFTRPIGNMQNAIKLKAANQTRGELITVTGTVVHIEAPKVSQKMICYRCSTCSTELVVKQNAETTGYVHPSTCHKGCPARSRFVELLSSPFTIIQPKQMIRLQESLYVENQEFKTLEVELIQDLVYSVTLGSNVTVTGVLKHGSTKKNQKFLKKTEAKLITSYLKCFSIELIESESPANTMSIDEQEVIQLTKTQPSPFRLLIHSLCPTIYGREEVKAGLILALLSGSNLVKKFRSESHVLMIGNPGVGKSKLLQACAEVSTKGVFVSGPTSTAVGLTASVGKSGVMDAGSL
jgi:DNA helicase MCM8